ncbi:hypothetical protein HMPREF1370_02420 [Enterococcus faecium P1123]|nr:hypothetical protein HMPREF1372_01163 [Enterococcus faecium P1139]EJX77825.1 hypothetical protein HMPREF1370_02420 [Enterococcus faecium P1123]EJY33146.1 hypothetical protein HMPREF1354_00462 [Enterococcus faecium 514]
MNADEGYQPSEFIPPFFFFVFSIVQIYRPKVQNENQFITSISDN